MLKETYLFFDEVLNTILSLMNFVSSDFTMPQRAGWRSTTAFRCL